MFKADYLNICLADIFLKNKNLVRDDQKSHTNPIDFNTFLFACVFHLFGNVRFRQDRRQKMMVRFSCSLDVQKVHKNPIDFNENDLHEIHLEKCHFEIVARIMFFEPHVSFFPHVKPLVKILFFAHNFASIYQPQCVRPKSAEFSCRSQTQKVLVVPVPLTISSKYTIEPSSR